MKVYDIAPEQIVGGYRVVSVDPEPSPYLGQKRLYCTVACLLCGAARRWIVPLLLRSKPKSCAGCTAAAQRDVTLVLPDGEEVSSRELRRRFPRAIAYIKELRIFEKRDETRAAFAKARKEPASVPVLDRARQLLADGWKEEAVAEVLEMSVKELRQLLRG